MAVILITGCSTGIGLEAALHLARRGHRIFAGARNPDTAKDLEYALSQEVLPVTPLQLDITDPVSVDAAVATVVETEGRIDVLINNAGIGGGRAVEETPIEEAREIFETNYFGQARMIQAVAPLLRQQGGGRIVNVGSLAGRVIIGCHAHYSASKAAMEALSEALVMEMAPFGVKVSVIEPGVVITPIWGKGELPSDDSPYAASSARMVRLFAFGFERPAMPSDVAEAITDAVESDTPKFRYPVGLDAEEQLAARDKAGDEEWIRINCLQGDEFADAMQALIGVDYYRGPLASEQAANEG